jgi:hypothetical protein
MSKVLSHASSVVVMLLASSVAASAAQADLDIRWTAPTLSVHLRDASRATVLERIAQLANVEIIGLERVEGTVSAEFTDKALSNGLDQLLEGYSFALVERPPAAAGGPVRYTLRIVGAGKAAPAGTGRTPIVIAALQQTTAESPEPPDSAEEDEARAEKQDFEQELGELEASGMFADDAPLAPITEAAQEHDNPLVRIRALQVLNKRDASRAIKVLIDALADNDDSVADVAVEILSKRTDALSLQRLGEILGKTTDTGIRLGSLRALAFRADPACVPALKAVADDKDPLVKDIVGQMLAEFASRERLAKGK